MSTVHSSLNSALHQIFSQDDRVFLIGQDVLDPYGGAFKVTQGLSTAFPSRVLTAPISESGMVGVASGMAMRGLLPIVEIMFGDFLTLAADQIINHMAKFRWMYNDQVQVPVVVRTPMGGRRGYGPTHSQTLEKLFLGVPNLVTLAPTNLGNPGALLKRAVFNEYNPVLFVENKLLYPLSVDSANDLSDFEYRQDNNSSSDYPFYWLTLQGAPQPVLTIASYGYMAEIAKQAVYKLGYEYEIFTELVVITQLSPININPLIDSLRVSGTLLTVEEGGLTLGWGAEILARVAERLDISLNTSGRVAALDLPIPSSPNLEAAVLPGADTIVNKVLEMFPKQTTTF
jgi:pyruvate/2-oxoglutarate/acetoin dehydrogenase E1 component